MKQKHQRNGTSRKNRLGTLKQAVLLSALMGSPALYAESYRVSPGNDASHYVSGYAENKPVDDDYPTNRYDYSAWWIAGIGAASVAGLTSNSIGGDKKRHYSLSLIFGAASEFGLRQLNIAKQDRWKRIALATAIGTVPGLLKEIADDQQDNNQFDKKDLLADALGSFAGALLFDLIQGPAETEPRYGVVVGVDQVGLAVNYSF